MLIEGSAMHWRRMAYAVAIGAAVWAARPATVPAGTYDDSVKRAEQLWADGRKIESVQLYGSIWRLNPDDVDRQILYGERSAEVGNFRWALNFFKVAEAKVSDDPARLRKVYLGYSKAYRMAGYPDRAKSYDEKAAALQSAAKPGTKIKKTDTVAEKGNKGAVEKPDKAVREKGVEARKSEDVSQTPEPSAPYFFGYYTEKPPEPAPTAPSQPADPRRLKKRIAVAQVTSTVSGDAPTSYTGQLRAMLIGELSKSSRFAVVDNQSPDAVAAGARWEIKAAVTEISQTAPLRPVTEGALPNVGVGKSAVRLAMEVRLLDPATGIVIASGQVAAGKEGSGQDQGVTAATFRWDDPKTQGSPLGLATSELVQRASEKVLADTESLPWKAGVTSVSGSEIAFDAGSDEGVWLGDRFKVLSVGEPLTDPGTGEVLGVEEKEIGEAEVVRVERKTSAARVVRTAAPVKRGDRILPP